MIFPLLRHTTIRCQNRVPKLYSFSTSPCRRSNGNSNDVIAEHSLLRSIVPKSENDEPKEISHPEELYTVTKDSCRSPEGPLAIARDGIRAPAFADPIRNMLSSREYGVDFRPSPENPMGTQANRKEHGGQRYVDLSSLDRFGDELGKPFTNMKMRLAEALRVGDTEVLLVEFWEATRDPAVMGAIPSTTFLEVLRLLDPGDEFAAFRREYGEWHQRHHMLKGIDQKYFLALQHRRTLHRDIWHRRLRTNACMDVLEYSRLLGLARATWDGDGALLIMKDMLRRDLQPDFNCYNYYFEARCWSDVWHPLERQRLRVIPSNMSSRRKNPTICRPQRNLTLNGYRIEEGGLKWEITRMFSKMIGDGIAASTRAFGHLITALAREGDMEGVRSILKKAWDIDVDDITQVDNDCQAQERIPKDSASYPDTVLLFILAHAFGSNNDIPVAIRVVDYVARKFEVRIPKVVWGEMLEWTFVLSTRRNKLAKMDGSPLGQLPLQSVRGLWNVMTSKPYCIRPKLDMYNLMVRSMWRLCDLKAMLENVHDGLKIDNRHHLHYRKRMFLCSEQLKSPNHQDAKELQFGKRFLEIAERRFSQSWVTVHRWFKLLLCRRKWLISGAGRDFQVVVWERQGLPNVVDALWKFRSRQVVEYNMDTGFVLLQDSRSPMMLPMHPDGILEPGWAMEDSTDTEADSDMVEEDNEDEDEDDDEIHPFDQR